MTDLIIKYDTLLRIAYYSSSHYPDEAITQEMFRKAYGSAMGDHYYSKWAHLYKFDVLKMVQYFGRDKYEGHQFLTMLKHKIEQYEQRVGR
ncbi:MAG: hypothetical protein SNG69_02430 [Rikenellaceae bacterium]